MAGKRPGHKQNDPNQSDSILPPTCKRSRGNRTASTQCPVCGLTLREGQFQQHYQAEVKKVAQIRTKRRKHRPSVGGEDGREDGESSRQSTSERTKEALTAVRRHRLVWRCTNPLSRLGGGAQDGHMCPLCGENIPGAADELVAHVDVCMQGNGPEAGDVSSGEESVSYEEYEWAGQTRIRLSTLLPPSALPDHVVVKRQGGGEGEGPDADIDIEGDGDVDDFGPHQYEEDDLIPCKGDDSEEEGKEEGDHVGAQVPVLPAGNVTNTTTSGESCSAAKGDEEGGKAVPSVSPSSKGKGKAPSHQSQLRCPVCMDSYRDPVVSVKCWHVLCEECWLRALGAKKLCPKCSLITAAGDLRRIYL